MQTDTYVPRPATKTSGNLVDVIVTDCHGGRHPVRTDGTDLMLWQRYYDAQAEKGYRKWLANQRAEMGETRLAAASYDYGADGTAALAEDVPAPKPRNKRLERFDRFCAVMHAIGVVLYYVLNFLYHVLRVLAWITLVIGTLGLILAFTSSRR